MAANHNSSSRDGAPLANQGLGAQLSPVMFFAAALFIVILGGLLHLANGDLASPLGRGFVTALAMIYPLFPLEWLVHRLAGSRLTHHHAWAALIPPLRLGCRDRRDGQSLWLPIWGWCTVDRSLEQRLYRAFTFPMMAIALIVLPVVLVEYIWAENIEHQSPLRILIESLTALIWSAFVIEFVLMISVVKYKWTYTRRHWIDLVVILLPMIAFLRAARIARLTRLNQIGKTIRLYRVRGLLMRTWRAIVTLEVIDRIIYRTPESRLQRLHLQKLELHRELEVIHAKIERFQRLVKTKSATPTDSTGNAQGSPAKESRGESPEGEGGAIAVPLPQSGSQRQRKES